MSTHAHEQPAKVSRQNVVKNAASLACLTMNGADKEVLLSAVQVTTAAWSELALPAAEFVA
jgi:hypothetical protein